MIRTIAISLLILVALTALLPVRYEQQFRDSPSAAPSKQFPLGTDDLGRDRLSRLIYGTRVSLLLATAAAGSLVLHRRAARRSGGIRDRGRHHPRHGGFVPIAALAVPIADGEGFSALERLADAFGNHHIPAARRIGLGCSGEGGGSGGSAKATDLRFHSASPRHRMPSRAIAVETPDSEHHADPLGPTVDHHSGLCARRNDTRHARPWSNGASSILGQFTARVGRRFSTCRCNWRLCCCLRHGLWQGFFSG